LFKIGTKCTKPNVLHDDYVFPLGSMTQISNHLQYFSINIQTCYELTDHFILVENGLLQPFIYRNFKFDFQSLKKNCST